MKKILTGILVLGSTFVYSQEYQNVSSVTYRFGEGKLVEVSRKSPYWLSARKACKALGEQEARKMREKKLRIVN